MIATQWRRVRRSLRACAIVASLTSGAVGAVAVTAPVALSFSTHGSGLVAYSIKTGIYAVHPNGTGSRLLVPWQTASCGKGCVIWKVPRHPRYSPDGQHLTYDLETNVVRNGVGHIQENTRTVYVADANGRHRRRIGLGYDPAFSPSGNEVVYLLNPDALPRVPLAEELPEPFGEDYGPLEAVNIATGASRRLPVLGAPEYSSSGQQMLFVHQVKLSDGAHWLTTVENVNGTGAQSFSLDRFYAELPRFSANGELSYDCPATQRNQPDICLFDPLTGRHRRLLHIHEFWALEAASSPSGGSFAVAGLQGLYVADANGHHPRRIVANGSGPNYVQSDVPTSPDWQPSP
jgi:Tol biopolymer transport system component